ncbi:MAG: hypothetical protein K2Q22_13420 [Cytophagales bacterium]|nr:hypothetical protein [Cytophagales bacterium]
MKKLMLIGLMSAFVVANAQDVIYFRNGAVQNGKVLQIDVNNISYKKAENPDGPTYVTPKSDVYMVEYPNGTKDLMGNNASSNSSTQQSNPIYSQPSQTYVRPQVNVVVAPPVYRTWGYYNGGYGWGGGWHHGGGYYHHGGWGRHCR